MTTNQHGKITTWKDDKGFGFITPDDGGDRVFFHITDLIQHQIRPTEQLMVTYTLSYDQQQRPRASNVRLLQNSKASIKGAQARSTQATLASLTFPIIAMGLFFLLLAMITYGLRIPIWVFVGYVVVSCFTFIAYADDKASAIKGAQRVPEFSLHILELLGGWPGALVAQSYYRHKTRKESFQAIYWGMVIVNLLVLALYIFITRSRT